MATATSPGLPVQHRQIGAELRRYRKLAGLTAIRAAAELGCGHSKISKIENAKLGINDTELALLLTLYNVPSDKADQLRAINGQPRPAEWWKAYRDAVPDWFQRYLSLESIATEIRKYEIEVIPGAFQTEEYARATLRAWEPEMGDIAIRDQLLLRMERQSILTRSDPVDFTAVLSEAALRKMVGGTGIMRRQLDKLGEIAQLPNVTLHVLPFDAPPHPIANSPFVLLGFPEEDESIVYLEDADGATYLTKPPEIIGRYTLVFSRLRAAALNPDDSLAFIAKIAEDYR